MKIIGLTPLYDVAENRLFMLRKYIELIERKRYLMSYLSVKT